VSGRSRVIDFSGAVNIQYDGMTLQGPEANFSYSSENILSQIQMKSGVDFSDTEKTAQAGEMIFDLIKNQLNFKGQPKVVQDQDEFSGEEIILLDGGKKVKVERLRARVENKNK
jgi:lipopolysaccharide export system protein LptA